MTEAASHCVIFDSYIFTSLDSELWLATDTETDGQTLRQPHHTRQTTCMAYLVSVNLFKVTEIRKKRNANSSSVTVCGCLKGGGAVIVTIYLAPSVIPNSLPQSVAVGGKYQRCASLAPQLLLFTLLSPDSSLSIINWGVIGKNRCSWTQSCGAESSA